MVSQIFTALADPTRRGLLELLGRGPAYTATWLARQVPVSRQAVVQHLAVLEGAGPVGSHRGEVLFSVRPHESTAAASWLTDRAGVWQDRSQALKNAAEAPHLSAQEEISSP
jgi:hypothetical protein